MHPVDALALTGGTATYGTLLNLCGRRAIERAVEAGDVEHLRHGLYALPTVNASERLARSSAGILCLASAAQSLGWGVKEPPTRPQICFPRGRRLGSELRRTAEVHWADLDSDEVHGISTSPAKTVEMCARTLPFHDALAIADSALRAGFEADVRVLRHSRGRGAARLRRIAAEATAAAANPFESVLRAIALDVEFLHLRPQVWIGDIRPDLVDEELRLVVEADSFEWHGGRAALHRDANRYNALTSAGWTVLRFSWDEVMRHPERVRAVLEQVAGNLHTQKSAR